MTRREQINQAGYAAYYDPYDPEGTAKQDAFEKGAEWADGHPRWISVEDERIRKKLISFVENWKNFRPNSPFDDYAVYTSDRDECDRILAWLEKQGHM